MSYDIKGWLLSGADTFLVVKKQKKNPSAKILLQ